MMLHTSNPQSMSLPGINFPHLTVADIYPLQDITGQGHYGKVKRQIKGHTMTLHTYNPQSMSYQISTSYTL